MDDTGPSIPEYLLRTPYGEELLEQLHRPDTSTSRQELTQATRLATRGVFGSMPSRYTESEYDPSVISMLPAVSSRASRAASRHRASRDRPELALQTAVDSVHYNNEIDDPMDISDSEEEHDEDEAVEEEEEEDDPAEAIVDDEDSDLVMFDQRPGQGFRRVSSHARDMRRRSSAAASVGRRSSMAAAFGTSGFKYPLPLKWDVGTNAHLSLTDGGLGVKSDGRGTGGAVTAMSKNYDYHSCKADCSVPVNVGVFYYEVKITAVSGSNMSKGTSDVSIGFMNSSLGQITKMAGLEIGTYGFNGHDGSTTSNQTVSRRYSRKFGQGDVIGCGVNYSSKTIFFTKNGVYLGVAFKDVNKSLIPVISLKDDCGIVANFGLQPFVFDIEGYVDQEKRRVLNKVLDHTSTLHVDEMSSSLEARVNTITDKELPTLMQKLVASYFDHLGYVDISKTFAEEIKKERLETAPSSSGSEDTEMTLVGSAGTDNDDAANLQTRQRVRKLLLDGNIDHVIDLTNSRFPSVFKDHEEILFKLYCNKFIQLIKRTRIDDAIKFGQSLRERYSSSVQYQEYLNDIFSLLAYPDPEESEFSYLLKEDEILKISDELNSEILQSLGKSSTSEVERLMKHTKAILKVLNTEKSQADSLLLSNEDFGL